jgi:hypothetical protein
MTKVYRVWFGQRWEEFIEAEFSTQEKAQSYLSRVNQWVGARDRIADPYDNECRYNYINGTIEEVELDEEPLPGLAKALP